MSNSHIIHRTKFEFPLDRGFFGNSFVIANLVKHSGFDCSVDCWSKYLFGDENLTNLNRTVAKKEFGADLTIDPYFGRRAHELRENVSGELPLEEKLEFLGQSMGEEGKNLFDTLLENYLEGKQTVMTMHYFGSDYDNISNINNMMGDMLKPVLYLHCMADFFFKNTKKSEKEARHLGNFVEENDIACVAVNERVKKSYESFIDGSRITVIPNGASQELYSPISGVEKARFKENIGLNAEYAVGYIGRLDCVKGSDYLFDTLKRFNEKNPHSLGFIIASSNGKELGKFLDASKKHLRNLLEDNKLKFCLDVSKLMTDFADLNTQITNTNKEFVEKKYDNKVPITLLSSPLHPHLDVYFHPSRNEGMPLSVIEAYLSKVPIVASRAGNIPDIAAKGYGKTLKLKGSPKEECGGFYRLLNETVQETGKYGPPDYSIDPDLTARTNASRFDDFVRQL